MRKDMLAGATAVGAALIGGAAFYYLRERQTGEPDFRPLESDGDYQIRDYPAITVAETVVNGPLPTISSPSRATARNWK